MEGVLFIELMKKLYYLFKEIIQLFCNGTVMLKISKLEINFTKTLTFKAFSCIIKISIKR